MFRAQVLVVRRSKFYYRVSGIITPIGGRPVHGTHIVMTAIWAYYPVYCCSVTVSFAVRF